MGDDLGEEWWNQGSHSDVPEVEEEEEEEREEEEQPAGEQPSQKKTGKKRKQSETEKPDKAQKKKKKTEQKKECFVAREKKEDDGESTRAKRRRKQRNKKKTITDVLASSEPKPGCPADLQNLAVQYFSDKRSVIEMEELRLTLQDSCFLTSNDLTHSLSSYLKEVCPKWAKVQKQHTEKSSVVMLIVCSSALRTIDLIKQLTTFKGGAKVLKLFAKHIKVEEQVTLLQRGVTHIGVGTPGRLRALVEKEGLNLRPLRYLVLDWNWRDQKLRRMADVPEVKLDLLNLLDAGILTGCREGHVKVGLF